MTFSFGLRGYLGCVTSLLRTSLDGDVDGNVFVRWMVASSMEVDARGIVEGGTRCRGGPFASNIPYKCLIGRSC